MSIDQSSQSDNDRADRRPPHPVHRQFVEQVFDPVERGGQQHRLHSYEQPNQRRGRKRPVRFGQYRSHGEHGAASDEIWPPGKGNHRSNDDRYEAAWLPFE